MWKHPLHGLQDDKGLSQTVNCEEHCLRIKKPVTWRSPVSTSLERWACPQKTLSDCFKTIDKRDTIEEKSTKHDANGSGVALNDVLLVRRSSTVELSPNLEEDALQPPTERRDYEATVRPKAAVSPHSLLKARDVMAVDRTRGSTNPSHMCQFLLSKQQDAQRTAAGLWFGDTGYGTQSQHYNEPVRQKSRRSDQPMPSRCYSVISKQGFKHSSPLPEADRRIPGMFKRACQQDLTFSAKKQCLRPTLGASLANLQPRTGAQADKSVAREMVSAFDDNVACEPDMQHSEDSEDGHREGMCSPSVSSWMMPCSMAPEQQPGSPVLVGKLSGGVEACKLAWQGTSVTPACGSLKQALSPTRSVHTPPERIGVSMQPPGAPIKKTRAAFKESELQYMSSGELYDASERSVFDNSAFAPGAPEWSPRQGVRRVLRFDDLSMDD